jgi:hypothetical protein
MTDRWHDNRRETPEEKIERRFATVDKLGEFHGSDKPSLLNTKEMLDALKGEHCHLSGEKKFEPEAAVENARWLQERFSALGFEYDEVYSLALGLGLQFAEMLMRALGEEGQLSESELRGRLMVAFGDTWIDGLLIGAEHRKAVE